MNVWENMNQAWANYYENGIIPNLWKGITGQTSADRNADRNLGFQQERASIEDERYNEETAYNREWAENQRDYERQLQQTLFEREDTALERQASQLSKLGINPLSQQLNGLGAGSAVSSAGAPSASSRMAETPQRADTSRNNLGYILELFNSLDTINTSQNQRDLLRQQSNIAKAEAESQQIDNAIKMNKNGITINDDGNYVVPDFKNKEQDFNQAEFKDKNATAERNERENQFQKDWNVTDKTDSKVRTGVDIADRFSTQTQKQKELSEMSPVSKAGKAVQKSLTNSYNIVANALENTVGAGAKYLYNAGSKKVNKFKKWWKEHTMSGDELSNRYGKSQGY